MSRLPSKEQSLAAEKRRKTILSVVLACVCIIYVLPVLSVVINSFKLNTFVKTDTFALPTGDMWAGFNNFIKGMTFGNYPFVNSPRWQHGTSRESTLSFAKFSTSSAFSPW